MELDILERYCIANTSYYDSIRNDYLRLENIARDFMTWYLELPELFEFKRSIWVTKPTMFQLICSILKQFPYLFQCDCFTLQHFVSPVNSHR